MAGLEFTTGPLAGQTVEVGADLTIGRLDGDLIVADQGVSGRHALLQPTGDGRIEITDLDSSNGTWVDGARIAAPVVLAVGSRLRVGGSEATVVAAGAPAETDLAGQPAASPAAPPTQDPPIEDTPPPRRTTPVAPARPPGQAPAARSTRGGLAVARPRGTALAACATALVVAIALIVYLAAK